MIDQTDFAKKQIVFYFPSQGDKMSFLNDNLVIKNKDGETRVQLTCYRIFLVFVVGDTTITTGLLHRANRFGFSFCMMNRNMKVYRMISSRMEGNTILRKKQYNYEGWNLAKFLVSNKIKNQRTALIKMRSKTQNIKDAVEILDSYIIKLKSNDYGLREILGIEGSASRLYFPLIFNNVRWTGRKPRIKHDYVNACLDIGYTILFNFVSALVNEFGFDEYCGVMHRCFYMRKSLICDLMEPMRPIIDYTIRKSINLGQFQEDDFKIYNQKYTLEWKASPKYTKVFQEAIFEHRNEIFLFIRDYYRAFMKEKDAFEFSEFLM